MCKVESCSYFLPICLPFCNIPGSAVALVFSDNRNSHPTAIVQERSTVKN